MEVILILVLILIFLFVIGLCMLAGAIAHGKGRSFWGPFLLSFIFTPLGGIIVACCMV